MAYEQFKRDLAGHLQRWTDGNAWAQLQVMTLGAEVNSAQVVEIPAAERNADNEVYCTDSQGQIVRAINLTTVNRYDTQVWVGIPPIAGERRQFVKERFVKPTKGEYADQPGAARHAQDHSMAQLGVDGTFMRSPADPVWVDARQLTSLCLTPTGGLTMQVLPGFIPFDPEAPLWFQGGGLDLTSNVPGTAGQMRYVLIQIDSDGNLSATNGSTFTTRTNLSSRLPAIDATKYPAGYVFLENGQTSLTYAHFWVKPWLHPFGSTAGQGTAQTFTGTEGETLAVGDPVFQSDSDGEWYVMDTDATPPLVSRHRAIVTDIADAPTVTLQSIGVCEAFTGLTADSDYWVDTDGTLTATRPTPASGGGQIALVYVGRAVSTTAIDLKLDTPVQYMIRDAVADDGTLTIEHHDDPDGRLREVRARISTTVAGTALTEYTSGNQDGAVALEGPSGAGGNTDINATGATLGFGASGGSPLWAAQSFQVAAGLLYQIKVTLGANSGSPTGTATWEVRDDNAGDPGTILDSGTFSPTPSSENTINITGGPFLAASTTYWLVLRPTSAQSASNQWIWQAQSTSSYANGNAAQSTDSGSSWIQYDSSPNYDAECQIYTDALNEYDRLAQGFQVTGAQTPYSVKLYLRKVGSPTGTLTAAIFDDVTGNPVSAITNGTANTVAESSLSTSFALVEFVFATPPSLSGSTQYHLVLDTDRAGSATNYVEWGADTSSPSYANGGLSVDVSSTWDASGYDAIFEVTDQGTSFDGAVDVGHVTVGSPTVGTRFDDGAGANADTNTTFQNLSGSELDLTCIVEVP